MEREIPGRKEGREAAAITIAVLAISMWLGVVYVVIHFIIKFW